VLTNRKPEHRKGKVQLIDATKRFTPRRKNLGQKNADLSVLDQQAIVDAFLAFEETETSKIFPNEAFGYRKVTVERPLRLRVRIPEWEDAGIREDTRSSPTGDDVGEDLVSSRIAVYDDLPEPVRDALQTVVTETGTREFDDYAAFEDAFTRAAKRQGVRLTAALKKKVQVAVAKRDEDAVAVVRRRTSDGVEYEPDPELRDTEQIPLTESVEDFMAREVLPYAPDAWVAEGSEKIGYEVSFTRYFYKPKQLRTLAEIEADIRALERETDGLLEEILVTTSVGGEG
jgi:type I restriction enzyme M protein